MGPSGKRRASVQRGTDPRHRSPGGRDGFAPDTPGRQLKNSLLVRAMDGTPADQSRE